MFKKLNLLSEQLARDWLPEVPGHPVSNQAIKPAANSSRMHVIVMVGKGGSGKTTTAVNLACAIRLSRQKVAILDTDPSRSASGWRTRRKAQNIPVVECDLNGVAAYVERARRAGIGWIIVDTAPELSQRLAAAIRLADLVLITTRPNADELDQARKRVAGAVRCHKPGLCVLTDAPRSRLAIQAPDVRDARRDLVNLPASITVWRREITHRQAVVAALAAGLGVVEAEPHSTSADEMQDLWAEVRQMTRGHTR